MFIAITSQIPGFTLKGLEVFYRQFGQGTFNGLFNPMVIYYNATTVFSNSFNNQLFKILRKIKNKNKIKL